MKLKSSIIMMVATLACSICRAQSTQTTITDNYKPSSLNPLLFVN
jgi:hypothetical protein